MNNRVLVITNKEDVTVDFVIDKLKKHSISYYRFNTEDIGSVISILFDGSSYFLKDKNKNTDVEIDEFDSIYFMRPKLPQPINNLTPGEQYFYSTEITTYLEGLYRSLSEKYWLNSVFDIRMLENKPYQISMAKGLGLNVPELCISNDFDRCREFVIERGQCIFKPLKVGLIQEPGDKGKVLYTTKVDKKYMDNIETHGAMPVYLQEQINKNCDVRVTVVGNNVFSAKILSQDDEVSKIDWRKSESMLSHERLDLPDDIREKCLSMCDKFNLDFAAIDFVLDDNGRFWFLEINPNGQWAWIESLLEYPVSDEIAILLASGGMKC